MAQPGPPERASARQQARIHDPPRGAALAALEDCAGTVVFRKSLLQGKAQRKRISEAENASDALDSLERDNAVRRSELEAEQQELASQLRRVRVQKSRASAAEAQHSVNLANAKQMLNGSEAEEQLQRARLQKSRADMMAELQRLQARQDKLRTFDQMLDQQEAALAARRQQIIDANGCLQMHRNEMLKSSFMSIDSPPSGVMSWPPPALSLAAKSGALPPPALTTEFPFLEQEMLSSDPARMEGSLNQLPLPTFNELMCDEHFMFS